jgi:hypothetical protein
MKGLQSIFKSRGHYYTIDHYYQIQKLSHCWCLLANTYAHKWVFDGSGSHNSYWICSLLELHLESIVQVC